MPGSQLPQIESYGGVTVIAYGPESDRITEDQIPETLGVFLNAVETGHAVVLVDLTHVQFFGSSFIEVLFRAWNRVQQRPDGRFCLCGLTPNCAEVIQVTNLDRLWDVYPTRQAALDALAQPS